MKLCTLRQDIINKRLKGETYESIALGLGINRALVFHIETHENYKPSRHIKKLLGLEPDITYTSTRRKNLNKIARYFGHSSWCAYETALLNTIDTDKLEME